MTHQFLVSDAIDEVILGADWLEGHRCHHWEFDMSRLTIHSGPDSVVVELCAVNNRACVRRLYAASTVEVPPFSQMDIGAKTV